MRFAFRPLWQLSAAETAQVALSKAQTTAVYAGLNMRLLKGGYRIFESIS